MLNFSPELPLIVRTGFHPKLCLQVYGITLVAFDLTLVVDPGCAEPPTVLQIICQGLKCLQFPYQNGNPRGQVWEGGGTVEIMNLLLSPP